jgi:hypothetical protein
MRFGIKEVAMRLAPCVLTVVAVGLVATGCTYSSTTQAVVPAGPLTVSEQGVAPGYAEARVAADAPDLHPRNRVGDSIRSWPLL